MKAKEILKAALALMGEQEGGYETAGFEPHAYGMMETLWWELDELDCALKRIRPDADNRLPPTLSSGEEEVMLHPLICRSVLPFGLAHLLLLEEDPSRAAQFLKRYEAQRKALKKRFDRPVRHQIRNVYGKL